MRIVVGGAELMSRIALHDLIGSIGGLIKIPGQHRSRIDQKNQHNYDPAANK